MTHMYAYMKAGYEVQQINQMITGLKEALGESFQIEDRASTVVVKEVAPECCTDNLGVFALLYTPKGKGLDQKKMFAAAMDRACRKALGEIDVKLVIKEQASDMAGMNGVLRCNNREAMTAYELS